MRLLPSTPTNNLYLHLHLGTHVLKSKVGPREEKAASSGVVTLLVVAPTAMEFLASAGLPIVPEDGRERERDG